MCFVVAASCSPATRPVVQSPSSAELQASTLLPTCGNGALDEGELCDLSAEKNHACPDGWGVCYVCNPACNGYALAQQAPRGLLFDPHETRFGRLSKLQACEQTAESRPDSYWAPQNRRRQIDELGRIVLYERDDDGDGQLSCKVQYAYNARGDMVLNGTGKSTRIRYEYDASGEIRLREVDEGADGTIDWLTRTLYHPHGRTVLLEEDGSVTEKRFYDIAGRLRQLDHTNPQLRGRRWGWTYDGDRLVSSTRTGMFSSAHAENEWQYYSPTGFAVGLEDRDGDGTADAIWQETRDQYGRLVTRTLDHQVDGRIDTTDEYRYDAGANWTEHRDINRGEVTRIERRTFDDAGNVTVYAVDRFGNGRYIKKTLFSYNERGQVVSVEKSEPRGPWSRSTYDYSCYDDLYDKAPKATFERRAMNEKEWP